MFPWPATSAAGRLMAMSRLSPSQYLGGLYRRNLVDDHVWDESDAADRAREIVGALFDEPPTLRVVLCGWRVASAFEVRASNYWEPVVMDCRQTAVVIPHPSGKNRVYNNPSARDQTGLWMRWATLGEDLP